MSTPQKLGPERIGPYRILGGLGSGGMGTVYRAMQESLGREVALKVVNPASAADPRFQERFLREARAMAHIQSPFVVSCFDAGLADGQLYMALELVTGGDLLGLMQRKSGNLSEPLALALMRDCLEGLEALEAARLVHRDLKPANIFLSDHGRAKLADLGLARSVANSDADRATMAGMIMGTPAYISPEQARGEDDIDVRADIYSLGATLYHLLTGQTPFPANDPIGTLMRVLNDPLPDPRELRPDLSEATVIYLKRLLEKERTKRPPSARAARELLEELLRVRSARSTRDDRTPLPSPVLPDESPSAISPRIPVVTSAAAEIRSSLNARSQERTPLATNVVPADRPTTSASLRIDPAQLLQLAKRIVIDQDGLRAALALAPGASFPRVLLDQLLTVSGITYGLIEANLEASSTAVELPRRITLAKGDPPTPDAPGKTVRGEIVPAVQLSVTIRIADDLMQAAALYRPGKPPSEAEVRAALSAAGITTGLDTAALARFAGKPPSGGKLVVAKGSPAIPAVDAGWNLSVGPAGDLGLYQVEPGSEIATWRDSSPGTPGADVYGQVIAVSDAKEPNPDDLIGAGVASGRTRDGDLCLRSTRQGVVQQQLDGMVRVVGVVEVAGDLDASNPISTDDVVIVRGNILAGAALASTSDIIIIGNVADACISAGGDIEIRGTVGAGQELRAAGTVIANDVEQRRILAGNIRINGTMTNCEITATGAIVADKVIGGALAAGGDITVTSVGNSDGSPTVLWAGHHLSLDRKSELIRLEEAHHAAKRQQLVLQGSVLTHEQDDLAKRASRMSGAQFLKEDTLKDAQERIAELERRRGALREEAESERRELVRSRSQRVELEKQTSSAHITVGGVAYDGVTIRVGNREAQLLTDPQVRPTF